MASDSVLEGIIFRAGKLMMLEGGCNNLNQLAKMAHQQGFSLLKGKIMDLLDEFNKIIERI